MKARVYALLRRNKGADALESEFEFGKLHISIFIWMMQNAARSSDFFQVDFVRLIELGAKIEL